MFLATCCRYQYFLSPKLVLAPRCLFSTSNRVAAYIRPYKLNSLCLHRVSSNQRRCLAVYSFGDGWTGALGTGSVDSFAAGHDDDEPDEPILVKDKCRITAASAGWGHTTFISDGDLYVCGRAFELSTLLRLKRFPKFLRNYAVNHSVKYNADDSDTVATSPSFMGKMISWLVGEDDGPDGIWKAARRNSVLTFPSVIELPHGQKVLQNSAKAVDASAGLTAVISEEGRLHAFGLNHFGQCGIGETSNNVWIPTQVTGLSSQFAHDGRANLSQEYPITQVALGLQHGVALNSNGEVFSWGKSERGQLGIRYIDKTSSPCAVRVDTFRLPNVRGSQEFTGEVSISAVSAGMNHSAALCEDLNSVFVWGKNVARPTQDNKMVQDSNVPVPVEGLPQEKKIVDVSCGSHHTSILLEDGSVYVVGIATDDKKPVFNAIELIPAGVIDLPVRQFKAHFDRTTVVGKNGDQVLQAHLWSDENLRQRAVFIPPWKDHFSTPIQSVHRGWLHTVVVTDE